MHQSISNFQCPFIALSQSPFLTFLWYKYLEFEIWEVSISQNSRYYHVCVSTWGEIKKKVTRYKEMTLLWGQFNGSPTLKSCKKMEEEKEIFWFITQPLTLEHGEISGRWQGLGRNSLTRCLYCKVTGFKNC